MESGLCLPSVDLASVADDHGATACSGWVNRTRSIWNGGFRYFLRNDSKIRWCPANTLRRDE